MLIHRDGCLFLSRSCWVAQPPDTRRARLLYKGSVGSCSRQNCNDIQSAPGLLWVITWWLMCCQLGRWGHITQVSLIRSLQDGTVASLCMRTGFSSKAMENNISCSLNYGFVLSLSECSGFWRARQMLTPAADEFLAISGGCLPELRSFKDPGWWCPLCSSWSAAWSCICMWIEDAAAAQSDQGSLDSCSVAKLPVWLLACSSDSPPVCQIYRQPMKWAQLTAAAWNLWWWLWGDKPILPHYFIHTCALKPSAIRFAWEKWGWYISLQPWTIRTQTLYSAALVFMSCG